MNRDFMDESFQESRTGALRALLRRCVRLKESNFDCLASTYLELRRRGAQVGSTVDVESVISLVASELSGKTLATLKRTKTPQ